MKLKLPSILSVFTLFAATSVGYAQSEQPPQPLRIDTVQTVVQQPNAAQPDRIPTDKGAMSIHPILHSSLVIQWNGQTIYSDPYGGAELFNKVPAPDLVLITDIHGDHLHPETLKELDLSHAELIAPKAVLDQLGDINFKQTHELANGEALTWQGIRVEAIPMYNLPESPDSRHTRGRGNGYVLTLGGKRVYISGDTEDIPEMRQLKNIDVAFVCMNLPYTMDVAHAASAVLAFKPKIVYPFHFRGGEGKLSDVEKFKSLVTKQDPNIDVRLRDWYPVQ
ncbi:L-ascorbate metabolism protein UlaG, beta-lactamase superfamily [Catalinimonas alkaloidigena]|uniref:L-ascorbate metabolism protein UlaG, beta-lactamase superfamily n=1 Tax=Catalinimonas alkaloidigena TaxID=1075417 RepID=A0A1G9RMC6_9BACT|nr:MBL fold metallo-hydrolase [Catalinimonas alkaloidigena]SDM24406.1 L-ascorbate metabolism protein UlaG, beta-lactamase superfamily [Catalinimonas alkaloidigena]